MCRMHNCGSKALCEVAADQQAALCAVQLCCCRGLFSACNRMVSREHSGGWALQCTAVLVALLCTPTLLHSCSASDNLSISRSISRPLSPVLVSFVLPSSLHSPLIAFVLFMPIFLHTLKADCNPCVQPRLLYSSLNYPALYHARARRHARLKNTFAQIHT